MILLGHEWKGSGNSFEGEGRKGTSEIEDDYEIAYIFWS